MSIETTQPEIPPQRTENHYVYSAMHVRRAQEASAWIIGYLQDARINGKFDDAQELQYMMEVESQVRR